MKKFITKKRVIVFVVIVVIIAAIAVINANSKGTTAYNEVQVQVRDITTYLEFSGNIEAADVKNVYAEASGKILEVLVEEGDEVKEGDVIAILDSDDIAYNIQLKEAALKISNLTNTYNIKDSQTNLDHMKEQMQSGLNASLNSAQVSLLSAQEQYHQAADTYNKAKADLEAGTTSTIVNAKQALDAAKAGYTSTEYGSTHDMTGNSIDINEDYMNYKMLSNQQQIKAAEENLKLAKENAQKQVDDYYDALIDAENSLADAERNYNAAVLAVEQNLDTAQNALEKVQALSTQETSELELAHLKETLADYTICATMDGFVTSMSLKEGEFTTTATPACEITNFSKMQALVSIDEYDIAQVKVGDPVEIYLNALDTYYEGKISKISKTATVKNSVAYLDAEVEFETEDEINSGLSAEIKLIKSDEKNAVALPINAISYDVDNTAYVLTRGADGKAVQTPVTLGVSDGSYVQIVEGVAQGDTVLVLPTMNDYYQMMMTGGMAPQGDGSQGGAGNDGPQQ